MKKVLVIGVFNVLHPRHVRLLRFASECGDHLIVAVQSDKTSTQSIHFNEKLRLEGVQSNTYVNEAFLTDEDIEMLPNFIGKIATWKNNNINKDIDTIEMLQSAQQDNCNILLSDINNSWQDKFSRHPIHKDITVTEKII